MPKTANFDPFLKHEALHVAYLLTEMFDDHLLKHPAVANDRKIRSKAADLHRRLAELYQLIGQRNAGTPAPPEPEVDPEAPWAHVPARGPFLRVKEAAAYVGYSVAQYYVLAGEGKMPRPFKLADYGQNSASGVPKDWLDALIAHSAVGE